MDLVKVGNKEIVVFIKLHYYFLKRQIIELNVNKKENWKLFRISKFFKFLEVFTDLSYSLVVIFIAHLQMLIFGLVQQFGLQTWDLSFRTRTAEQIN